MKGQEGNFIFVQPRAAVALNAPGHPHRHLKYQGIFPFQLLKVEVVGRHLVLLAFHQQADVGDNAALEVLIPG